MGSIPIRGIFLFFLPPRPPNMSAGGESTHPTRRSRCESWRASGDTLGSRAQPCVFSFFFVFRFRFFQARRTPRARSPVFAFVHEVVGRTRVRRDRDVEATGRTRVSRARRRRGGVQRLRRREPRNKHAKGAERLFFTGSFYDASSRASDVVASSASSSRRVARPFPGGITHAHDRQLDLFDLGELPLLVAQRAVRARAQPLGDAVQVEHVPAVAPRDGQPLLRGARGVRLYSMDGSCRELRQIARVSVQMDHDHTATAFHCFGRRGGGQRGGSSWARRVARKNARGISV